MSPPAIVVHGGAGRIAPQRLARCRGGCRSAGERGWEVLAAGGSALDAVTEAVTALEDDPEFNAGTGAALNAAGRVQLDASIMDGATLAAGAVAAVSRAPNPILLARRVMEDGRHILLVAGGAERFAMDAGLPACAPGELIVRRQRRRWRRRHGTVGCVAIDREGRMAAATSTGGRTGALPGRVGDSAVIGAGTYAGGAAGVSCTGIGEAIIRVALAHRVHGLVEAGGEPGAAARLALAALRDATGAEAGVIAVARGGRVGHAHNAAQMPVWGVAGGVPFDAI